MMKNDFNIVFVSQSGMQLDLSKSNFVERLNDSHCRNDRAKTLPQFQNSEESEPKLQSIIDFFNDIPSYEKITIIVTYSDDSRHVITMTSQSAVIRLLPFLLLGSPKEAFLHMPRITFSVDTHPFLKSGWIQEELCFIVTNSLLKDNKGDQLDKAVKAIKSNFKIKLEALYSLHNHVVSLETFCSPLCNGLATAIMCVEYILLNPRDVLERTCLS